MAETEVRPQAGFQEAFLASPADIVIGGSGAGVGKTFALLLETCRHVGNTGFSPVVFRRTTPQIRASGGLWEKSFELYPLLGGEPKETLLQWNMPSGASIKFTHLEYEKDVLSWQGSEIPLECFDELTHFTKNQFFYMLSRNRSMCGVTPYVRATCNPDPDSWVAEFISWWIGPDGFPIPERAGVLRYFTKDGDSIVWGNTPEEVLARVPHLVSNLPEEVSPRQLIKSVTFIPGRIAENKKLLSKNPEYLANLMAQDETEKQRLLHGNWKVSSDGMALCDFEAVNDLFTNPPPLGGAKCVTADAARFGRDFAVSIGWDGYQAKIIIIRTKCTTSEQVTDIEHIRSVIGCGKSEVLVDQDGVGGGVVDEGGYKGFSGGSAAAGENYRNLKTQCAYRFASEVNLRSVSLQGVQIYVDGRPAEEVPVGKESRSVRDLIRDDLRSFRRKDPDDEGRKKMNAKEEQKNMLGGRSPDFGDALAMRSWFDLFPSRQPYGVATL